MEYINNKGESSFAQGVSKKTSKIYNEIKSQTKHTDKLTDVQTNKRARPP